MSEPTAPLPPAGGSPPYGRYGGPPVGPYGPQPPRSGSGGVIAAAVLSVVFVAASLLVALVANSGDSSSSRATIVAPTVPGGSSGFAQASASSGSSAVDAPQPSPSSPSSSTSVYSPPPTPTPTRIPLSGSAINRTFEVYMNALLYHNLSALKSATCPRLRHTETGTALHGKYIHRWKGNSYEIYNDLDYVRLSAKVYFDVGGTATYDWYVERDTGGNYYVCGFLS